MIHEEICTYEVAKLAKEKGFDVPTAKNYRHKNGTTCNAPIQSQLQKWLREEKGLHITVPFDNNEFWWQIKNLANGDSEYGEALGFDTYELALEDALKYALENLVI